MPSSSGANARAKPRVLVVDDNRAVLESISAVLADDFEVAGVASNGQQALDTAREVSPDVIVLDVEMPKLDGFGACRAFKQDGFSTIPIVFLSVHDSDEYVSEALRCGGHGYVLKSRAGHDLPRALDKALLGGRFVPSLTSLLQFPDNGVHAMQMYSTADSFLDGLATFFDRALRRGDATCVFATKEIREGLEDRLNARDWNVGNTAGHNRYLAVDAEDALARFMVDGCPDATRLTEIVAELDQYRHTVAEGPRPRLTIFGNMVMLLSARGNTKGVVMLEQIWNTLTQDLPFLTLCGYATKGFEDGMDTVLPEACAEHGVLCR